MRHHPCGETGAHRWPHGLRPACHIEPKLFPSLNAMPRLLLVLIGAGFVLLGLFVLLSGGVSLPTRQPPRHFHFGGVSLLLLGLAPMMAGWLTMALGRGAVTLESRTAHGLIVGCLVALGLAFALATRV